MALSERRQSAYSPENFVGMPGVLDVPASPQKIQEINANSLQTEAYGLLELLVHGKCRYVIMGNLIDDAFEHDNFFQFNHRPDAFVINEKMVISEMWEVTFKRSDEEMQHKLDGLYKTTRKIMKYLSNFRDALITAQPEYTDLFRRVSIREPDQMVVKVMVVRGEYDKVKSPFSQTYFYHFMPPPVPGEEARTG